MRIQRFWLRIRKRPFIALNVRGGIYSSIYIYNYNHIYYTKNLHHCYRVLTNHIHEGYAWRFHDILNFLIPRADVFQDGHLWPVGYGEYRNLPWLWICSLDHFCSGTLFKFLGATVDMVATSCSSCTTIDGSHPTNHGINHQSTGAGFRNHSRTATLWVWRTVRHGLLMAHRNRWFTY